MVVELRITREGIKTEPEKPSIQTCPLLLRGFTKDNGHHHHMDEFSCRNVPSASTPFNFAVVFTDLKSPGYRSQNFQMGDYLDIAITPAHRAPPPSGCMRPH
ncbi:hypothetical protein AB1E18_017367 [Capra hircus]